MAGFIFWTDGIIQWFATTDITEDTKSAFEDAAGEVENYAQSNAPWLDRTGDARGGLTAEVIVEGDSVILELSHSVDYGQWLETIQNGEFAIIMPTLEKYAPEVFSRVWATIANESGEDYTL